MSYAHENDLRDRLGSDLVTMLADEDGDGTGDAALLQQALDDASAEIDAALAGRYAVPVSPVPPVLIRMTVDLAVNCLFMRRRGAISPEFSACACTAREQLAAFGSGSAELSGATARLRRLESESTTREQERHFDRDALDSF